MRQLLQPRLAGRLQEARARTLLLASGLSDADLAAPALPILGPPVWDLGHMANFHRRFLVQRLTGAPATADDDTYDPMLHPRPERPRLRLPDRAGVLAYMARVQEECLAVLVGLDLDGRPDTRDGALHELAALHEEQHQETLLQTIALRHASYRKPAARPLPEPMPDAHREPAWVRVPAGAFEMGTPMAPGVHDNEAPPHQARTVAFEMARFPVTNGDYLEFLEEGGYHDPAWWSEDGRAWLEAEPHHAPLHWSRHGDTWHRAGLQGTARVRDVADEILCHVGYWEAEAYAAWAGARLPTEAEWEKACRGPDGARRNPWGNAPATTACANLDHLGWGPARAGAYPAGTSPYGVEHMVGDVWEWTSSSFLPYRGFAPFAYEGYSAPFFGGPSKALRGGSWATRAGCATGTFRNWDLPMRRQIFAGVRLARDAEGS
ncbi:MAG: gamma-glutamyl hercynylcysteine S-oxide synthase [Thermoplasmata archaeon]|jgi:iron(II)-dependent oxidoreductase|nr:gamma-glutamyl hercynylcysteine S-oxide synthase [Thermoplasmata archaeon]